MATASATMSSPSPILSSVTSRLPEPPSSPGIAEMTDAAEAPGNAASVVVTLRKNAARVLTSSNASPARYPPAGDDRAMVEAKAGAPHLEKAAHHEIRPHQQPKAQGDLDDGERRLHAMGAARPSILRELPPSSR